MALSQFQRAVELAPDDLIGYYHLALMYQKLGKKNKAIAQFEKIIELTKYSAGQAIKDLPSYLGDVYYNLALNFEENEKIEKAKEYYEKALELNSDRIVRIYSRLKFLYKDKLGEIENIETKLLKLKPEYRVNYKFPNDLMLLGYSFNEKKFELFNEGEITFFWELPKQGLGIKSRGGDIYKISSRIYEIKKIKNLVPNFGFEINSVGTGFPLGWNADIYNSPLACHEIVLEKSGLGETQCLVLNNTIVNKTNCQSSYIAVTEGDYYLQGGRMKSINGNACFGRRWFDSENRRLFYDYVASGIKSSKWRFLPGIVIAPSESAYCRLWVSNYETRGKTYFDDITWFW